MYANLNEASKKLLTEDEFQQTYLDAQEVATVKTIAAEDPTGTKEGGGAEIVTVPVTIETAAFGTVQKDLEVPYSDGGVSWTPDLVFPGLKDGAKLASRIRLAKRASIVARDGTPLAEGPADARTSPLGGAAIDVAGQVGEAPEDPSGTLAAQGFPPGTLVGVSGLEAAYNNELAGKPGGRLLAKPTGGGAATVLAESKPERGARLKTFIDPTLQTTAVAALAGRSGGVAVLDATTGAVEALAGSAYSAPQPPGSTFKIITTTAAFQQDVVSMDDQFPVTSGSNVGGRMISNAHQELCGGSFPTSFADSCNSVFAPLGPKIGNDALVSTAERYGWNAAPELFDKEGTDAIDPPQSAIPQEIGDDLDLGVSAIGQGEVTATPLEMASVAQTVANGGVRLSNPIVQDPALGPTAEPKRVTSKSIAKKLTELMIGVVTSGTGVAGAIPEAQVAGKTGTAELGPKPGQENLPPGAVPEQSVDAWFSSFAPADKPKLAIGVMLIDADADGGTVAAPVAAQIFSAGL